MNNGRTLLERWAIFVVGSGIMLLLVGVLIAIGLLIDGITISYE